MSFESELESRAMANDLGGDDVCRCGHTLDQHGDIYHMCMIYYSYAGKCPCTKFTLSEPEDDDGE